MAEDTAAGRDRVLAARAELAEQLTVLEASGRAAVDIPARIKRSPGKVAAVVGGAGFLALKGPQRAYGLTRRAIFGKPAPLPKSMLPDEVEKTLRKLGKDGDQVRGALERDFAEYAKRSRKGRESVKTLVLLGVARPLVSYAARTLLSPDARGFGERLDEVRARIGEATASVTREQPATPRPSDAAPQTPTAGPLDAPAQAPTADR